MSQFIFYVKYYHGDQIKERIGKAFSTHERNEMHKTFFYENMNRRDHLGETGVNGRIISERI
jgi:hypothetical protein